jgi:SCY1-like protein 2
MRGLNKVLPSFPKAVMEKKVLPALLEELKDKELLSLILQNVFKIMSLLPSSRRAFGERVRPKLKEIFVDNAKQSQEKDTARDAGLMVVLENTNLIAENSSGKEFKDGMHSISPSVAITGPRFRHSSSFSQNDAFLWCSGDATSSHLFSNLPLSAVLS